MARPKSQTDDAQQRRVEAIGQALDRVAAGEDAVFEFDRAVDTAFRDAQRRARTNKLRSWALASPFSTIIATNLRKLRDEAGWTQDKLAAVMSAAGFGWKRVTVAEVEGDARKVSLEELCALAALYSEPLLAILLPGDRDALELHEGQLSPDVLTELLLGQDGQVGTGGPTWGAATATLAEFGLTPAMPRPAPELWRARETQTDRGERGHARSRKQDRRAR